MSDEQGRRALHDVWGWFMSGVDPLEDFDVDQLRQMAESLERAAAAVRRHIVRRGDE